MPLLPIFIIFFIGSVAETNRAPFDLAEAESELVSGFMTEHAAVIFVFFFLAEYGSIVLICILNTMLFLGGYLFDFSFIFHIFNGLQYISDLLFLPVAPESAYGTSVYTQDLSQYEGLEIFNSPLLEGMVTGLIIGIKSCFMIFVFI
jgi:NADH-ubiquinone oxidoreductase chain 1